MKVLSVPQQLRRVRYWVAFFILALILSGVTAFALETELDWLLTHWPLGRGSDLYIWVWRADGALVEMNKRYPFLAYGYDWLAFGHLIIALFFIGVFRRPIENKWVLKTGMAACLLVFPLAFIAGAVRGIPLYWRLIDCSFGVFGLVPLWICYRKIGKLHSAIAQPDIFVERQIL